MKSEKKLGLICLGWGILYAFVQTNHFGNNLFPQTKEEIICDITAIVFMAVGVILIKSKT